jgi:prophage antirepressor-like protein
MKEIIKIFNQEKIRVVLKNGEPYFNAQDICKNLELSNTSKALDGIDKDDITSSDVIDTLGRKVNVIFVSENGLYDLIFKSKKPEAKEFKKWVTHEVLPSIRKTGKYSIPENIKKVSTQNRNLLTSEWKEHGISKPHEYIQLTLQEHKALGIEKNKSEMTKHELLLYSALESMEALKLFENQDIDGYYACKDSLIQTAEIVKIGTKTKSIGGGQ